MKCFQWPVEAMAKALQGRVIQTNDAAYSIRLKNPNLGVKLKLDVDSQSDDIRLVVDRLKPHRPNFVGSMVMMEVVGVEIEIEHAEVEIVFADAMRLAINANCTFAFYRPA